jgi:hypothetical protein
MRVTWISALLIATTDAEARTDLLVELIQENGCRMTGEEAAELLPEHDFTKEETRAITTELFYEGLIRIDRATDTLILTTESCR